MLAAAALGKLDREDELCCHSLDVNNGSGMGKQTVFLVWVCDEYELLKDFLETPAAKNYASALGEIPPPFKISF